MAEPAVQQPQRADAEELATDQACPPAEATEGNGDNGVTDVTLRRLLAVTTLTPAQSGLLALDLVDELERHREENLTPGRVTDRAVTVSPDGVLALLDNGVNGDSDIDEDEQPGEEPPLPLAAAAALIQRLLTSSRGVGARRQAGKRAAPTADAPPDLRELRDRVTAAVTEAAGDEIEHRRERVRRELAALVAATQGRRKRQRAPEFDTTTIPPPAPRSVAPPRRKRRRTARRTPRTWHNRRRRPTRKMVLLTVVTLLLGALAWWGGPLAWAELKRGWDALFLTGEPSQQLNPVSPPPPPAEKPTTGKQESDVVATKATKQPEKVKLPAPKQADPITGVTVERAEGACTPGKVCPVRVDVRFTPAGGQRTVAWSLQVVNRCTGKVVKRDGVSMTARAGWHQVYGISRPKLPKGKALAIVAVTGSPAKAASPPLQVPDRDTTC